MKKESLILEMKAAIDTCKGTTCYTDEQIDKMKLEGEKIFSEIFAFDGTTVSFEDDDKTTKEVSVKFEKYVFGHNDFKVYCDDFMMKKALKEKFYELKGDEKKGIEPKIGAVGGNGYGTAFVFKYELK